MNSGRWVTLLVLLLSIVFVVPADAITIVCHPPDQKCHITLGPPDTASLSFHGSGAVAEIGSADPEGVRHMTWLTFDMSTVDSVLGTVTVGLDSARASTGTIQPVGLRPFPATNTIDFLFKMNVPSLGTLISTNPVRIQGQINSIPPQGTTYTMQNGPVAFYMEDDPSHTTVLTIAGASVNVAFTTIPAATPWAIAGVTVVLGAVATWVIVRRRRVGAASIT
jgi:hypothetical protein